MKNKYLVFSLLILFSACKSKSIVDQKISEYISKDAHNPDSYEPISTTALDTVTEIENINSLIESKINAAKEDTINIERNISMLKTDSSSVALHNEISLKHNKEINNIYAGIDSIELASAVSSFENSKEELRKSKASLQANIENLKILVVKRDSINKSASQNSIYSFHFLHQFRARVPIGGLMLKSAYIETDKDYNIISFEEGR